MQTSMSSDFKCYGFIIENVSSTISFLRKCELDHANQILRNKEKIK